MIRLLPVIALVACKATDGHPEPTPHADWIDDTLVLADGAARLLDFSECTALVPLEPDGDAFVGRAFPMADGSTLVLVAAACETDTVAIVDRWALVTTDGALVPVSRPGGAPPLADPADLRVAPVGGGLLLVDCAGAVGLSASASGALVPVDVTAMCAGAGASWAIGPGAGSNRLAFASLDGGVSAWTFTGSALVAATDPAPLTGFVAGDDLLWVNENGAGFGVLHHDFTYGSLQYATASGDLDLGPVEHDLAGHPPVITRDGLVAHADASGRLAAWRLDPAAPSATFLREHEAVIELPEARHRWFGPGSAISTGWDPDDDDRMLDSPAEILLRTTTFDAVTSTAAVPSTPCDERWRCRLVGDSWLVATAGDWAFYGIWDWYGYGGVYAAPIER